MVKEKIEIYYPVKRVIGLIIYMGIALCVKYIIGQPDIAGLMMVVLVFYAIYRNAKIEGILSQKRKSL